MIRTTTGTTMMTAKGKLMYDVDDDRHCDDDSKVQADI